MRTLLAALVLLTLVPACVYAPKIPRITNPHEFTEPAVYIGHTKTIEWGKAGYDWVWVTFHHNVEGYDRIVQEVYLDNGNTLVETFPNNCRDRHRDGDADSYRECIVYPACVEGIDATSSGFAQLPQNFDGSVKTTTGPKFNEYYQKNHKTQGRITKAARHLATRWTITWKDGKATYHIQEGMEKK